MSETQARLNVLILCTGNTCRSPLAVLALRRELGSQANDVRIQSAGTAATVGQPASLGSQRVAEAEGLDLRHHRSRPVTRELLQQADLVLVMSASHRAAARALGASDEKVHVISEWPEPGDPALPVFDPFGASSEAYEECWRRLQAHARRIAPRVLQSLRERRP